MENTHEESANPKNGKSNVLIIKLPTKTPEETKLEFMSALAKAMKWQAHYAPANEDDQFAVEIIENVLHSLIMEESP